MALISQSISSFKGGVSQQPDVVRYPDQLKEQLNAFSSEVEGLQKRPPTIHIGRLGDSLGNTKVKYHVINRDENEQYVLEMSKGNLRIWDLLGNPKTIKFPNGKDYLNVVDPEKDFGATTVADYTFILNKTKVVEMLPDKTPIVNENTVLFDVRSASYGKVYAIYINDVFIGGYRCPDGRETWNALWTTTTKIRDYIIQGINLTAQSVPDRCSVVESYDAMTAEVSSNPTYAASIGRNTNWGARGEYRVAPIGDSIIAIQRYDKQPFSFYVKDGFGGQNFYTCAGEVRSVNKLPTEAPNGYIVKVVGETGGSADDDYYLKWDDLKKVWKESLAEGIQYKINANTMPWGLIREADGTFTFKPLEWYDRGSGDEDSNPDPSFINKKINDIFFYRNRLGFIADENIILSASSDFFNFWFETATGVLDTDCIDVAVSSNKVSTLTHAIPFSRELMLFSREGQFVLGSDGPMTPKTVKVDQVASFEYNPKVQPLNIGNDIYFVNNRIDYCSLMRFYTIQDVADLRNAEDVSSHIPRYIPVGISRISGNSTENTITMISETNPNTIWIYKFIMANGTNLQQSWSKWTMGTPDTRILLAEFVNANIYFVLSTPSGLYLERAELTGNAIDFADEPVRLFMDRKKEYVIPSGSKYSDFNNYTEVSFSDVYGAVPTLGTAYFLVTPEGYVYKVSDWDKETGKFRVTGDLRNQKVFVGRQFEFRVDLSKIVIKRANAAGSVVSEDEGRLMLRYFWFNYADSGVFKTRVSNSLKHKEYTYTCTSKLLGRSDTQLGVNKVFSNIFKFPIHELNTEVAISILSDNVQPLNIISGGWEGLYTRRTQKV